MDIPGANAPDQIEDDRQFEKWCSEWGEQGRMASLMGVSRATVQRQLKSDDENHASDYHRGRRFAYASGFRQDEKGEQMKAGLDAAYLAGVRDRRGGSVEPVEFPAALAHEVIEVEWNAKAAARMPRAERIGKLGRLIGELTAYKEELYRDEEGLEREGGETLTPRPLQVAARG